MKQLITKELRLRQIEQTDADWLFTLTSDENVSRYMHFDRHTQPQEAVQMILSYLEKLKQGLYLPFVVESVDRQERVGVYLLKKENIQDKGYTITAFFGPQSWGKGYLTQIQNIVVEQILQSGDAEYLEAYIVKENIGSCKACLKAGFHLCKEITYDDWDGVLQLYRINRDGSQVKKVEQIHEKD